MIDADGVPREVVHGVLLVLLPNGVDTSLNWILGSVVCLTYMNKEVKGLCLQLVISTCLALVTAICIFLNLPWNIVYDGHVGQEPVDVQGFHLSPLPDHQDGLHTVAVVGLHAHSFGTVVC